MRAEIARIGAQPRLSKNLSELVGRALGDSA
jgi:hypothetical protein